tara:strand:+ start:5587 stop:5925 length:339 start_codon:yes stop_codon:yes gene_type:complete
MDWMMRGIVAAAVILVPVAGVAGALPQFDVPGYCRQVADSVGGSDMIRAGCQQQEQRNYNAVKARWGSMPERTQAYCVQVAQSIGGSYQILDGCLTQEMNSAGEAEGFEFQY